MRYVPSNRIKSNLYTAGGFLVYADTQEDYIGYYYQLYNGEYYTGKVPTDGLNRQLVPKPVIETDEEDQVVIPALQVDPDVGLASEYSNARLVQDYLTVNRTPGGVKKAVMQYNPIPTPEDYAKGEFVRFFAKKVNEPVFIEINQETFNALSSGSKDYLSAYYSSIRVPWLIAGDKEQVRQQNQKTVSYIESKYKLPGLSAFLLYDYTKFYQQ